MRVCLLLPFAVVLLAAAALPAVAAAALHPAEPLRWQRHEVAVAGPVGDGRSIIAWQTADGVVHTMGAGGAERRMGAPDGCDGATLAAAGATAVLLRCAGIAPDEGRDTYVIRDVATGRVRRTFGPSAPADGGGWTPTAIGALWIAGEVTGPSSAYSHYVPTTVDVGPPRRRQAADAPDLDARALWHTMCGGIRAHRWPQPAGGTTDRFLPVAADGRLVATADRRRHWTVRRCRTGGRTPEAVRGITEPPVLGGGLATWASSPSVISVLASDGRRRRIRTPADAAQLAARAGRVVAVADAARRIWTGWLPRSAPASGAQDRGVARHLAMAARTERLRWVSRGRSRTWALGDGASVVAWQSLDGVVHAIADDGSEHRVAAPAGCPPDLQAAGGGAVLFACTPPGSEDDGDRYAVVDVRTGATQEVRGPAIGGSGSVWSPFAMGRVWIAGSTFGHHTNVTVHVRRDGAPGAPRRQRAFEAVDLDRPGMYRRLCDGVRLRPPLPEGEDAIDDFLPALADGTFVATRHDRRRWTLRRCGAPGALRTASELALGGGLATWSASRTRIGVLQRDGRRRSLAKPVPARWAPARAGRVLALAAGPYNASTHRIWTAVVPRR